MTCQKIFFRGGMINVAPMLKLIWANPKKDFLPGKSECILKERAVPSNGFVRALRAADFFFEGIFYIQKSCFYKAAD